MLNINNTKIYNIPKSINQIKSNLINKQQNPVVNNTTAKKLVYPSSANLQAYIPSFSGVNKTDSLPSPKEQLKIVKSKLDKESLKALISLARKGLLNDNSSDDGSTVLENLYKIATEPRIKGLSDSLILSEVINALNNPFSITQKFGDIPVPVAKEIAMSTNQDFPTKALNVSSSSCVVASMEFNMASKTPAEFARFAKALSGSDYSVEKNIKLSDVSDGIVSAIWMLREFNTDYQISTNWEDIKINIKPDRNAIVRARVQSSYKDPGERSCVDVLIQSALLNLGSQHTYNAITDERTGKFNSDNTGLTDFEKNFVEQIVFEAPKISVVYQNIDETGHLKGYNCEPEETKQHILKSLELGQNVIIGYVHMDKDKTVVGGHEITIIGYQKDKNGNGIFICNDTDDEINAPIKVPEQALLPLIHHAGISKEALSKDDVIVEGWKEILNDFQNLIKES